MPRPLLPPLLVLSPLLLGLLGLRPAAATPFPLPPQHLAVDLSFTYDQADSQWDGLGNHGVFPIGGRFTAESLQLGLRYGIVQGLEAQVHTSYKVSTYQAAPLHLFPAKGTDLPPGVLTDQVFNVSGQDTGVSDVFVGLSYRPLSRYINLAVATELKVPTGYRPPSGTLCANKAPDELLRSIARLAPTDFCSGATLGDGQVDLLLLLELGKYIPLTRTFFRVEGGMNFRFQGPGQQVVAAAKAGENIRDVVILYAGARLAYTVNRGDAIGTTINSTDPTAPPDAYPGDKLGLLRLDVATRDRSYLFFDAGLIVRVLPTLELRGNYSRALWGINFPEVNSVSIGLAVVAL